jgi:hypothetical protein
MAIELDRVEIDRQTRGQSLENRDEPRPVRLTGRQKTQHARSIVLEENAPLGRAPREITRRSADSRRASRLQ